MYMFKSTITGARTVESLTEFGTDIGAFFSLVLDYCVHLFANEREQEVQNRETFGYRPSSEWFFRIW